MAQEDLLRCPFYGGAASIASEFRDGYLTYRDDPDKPSHFGLCRSCGVTGARRQTDAEAIRAWNRRLAETGRDRDDLWHALTDAVVDEP